MINLERHLPVQVPQGQAAVPIQLGHHAKPIDLVQRTNLEVPRNSTIVEEQGVPNFSLKNLVKALIKHRASDLHLKVGRPPLFRINGKVVAVKMPKLDQRQMQSLVMELLSPLQRADLEKKKHIDLSTHFQDLGRFRCNFYFQRGTVAAAVRMIPPELPEIENLGLPIVLKELVLKPRGLILITGATGSGKSTTMAAMIHYVNRLSPIHILTIEDPIEFIHYDLKATVSQREVGGDVISLKEGVYAGLRQDPDVIMIGELRDYEMIQVALSAAETGHLVLSTLHTDDAKSTIDRLIEVFPAQTQNQVRIQLATTLLAVVSQQLIPIANGQGRIPACEIMVRSPAIEGYIMHNEIDKITEAIANSNDYYHMQTMDQSLALLVKSGAVTQEEALACSSSPDNLKLQLSGLNHDQGFEMVTKFQK